MNKIMNELSEKNRNLEENETNYKKRIEELQKKLNKIK